MKFETVFEANLEHDEISPLVHPADSLLAACDNGINCLSHCLAAPPAFPFTRCGRFWNPRSSLGNRYVAGTLGPKADSKPRLVEQKHSKLMISRWEKDLIFPL